MPAKIILCNRPDRLGAALKGVQGPLRYISFLHTRESRQIRDYLARLPQSQELSWAQLFRERSKEFREKYISFLGAVNAANHSCLWWAMPFTNKNPRVTDLCRVTSYFLLVVDLIRQDDAPLLVITDDAGLESQVKIWAKSEGVEVHSSVSPPRPVVRLVKRHTPASLFKALFRTWLFWTLSRRHRRKLIRNQSYLVVATLTHPRSFSESGGYDDVYFGSLIDHLAAEGRSALVLGMVAERPMQQFQKLRKLQAPIPVLPLEACLTIKDLTACFLQALKLYLRPLRVQGPAEIDGVDLTGLLEEAAREACHSGDLFLNLRWKYCANWLAKTVRVEACLYPYENRAWEKMLLAGINGSSKKARTVGYQHTAVTPSHTNFIFAQGESAVTPLPDTICTTGAVVKDWLEREANYPPGILRESCALRLGEPGAHRLRKEGEPISRILVALASSLEEYINALVLLEQAFNGNDGYQVRVRPHPSRSISLAMEIAPLSQPNQHELSFGPLADDLEWADVVLYSSSTVGMEAVASGIPAVHLDLGDYLDSDPLFGWDEFKWSAVGPQELLEAIHRIDALSEDQFLTRQRQGREYVAAYLRPVTPAGLAPILEALG